MLVHFVQFLSQLIVVAHVTLQESVVLVALLLELLHQFALVLLDGCDGSHLVVEILQ